MILEPFDIIWVIIAPRSVGEEEGGGYGSLAAGREVGG